MKYRPDIDGLRAVAVLPVLFYHAGLGMSGGFVGVDVFFVISGYLITYLIIAEIDERRFSIIRFYERRARRLFPALFAMLAATTVACVFIMVPFDLEDFGKSVVATTLFAANIWFYMQEGYFNEAAELHPLLHTWSLGVEEQYYVVFPIVLLVLARFLRFSGMFAVVGIAALGSLAASVYMLQREPEAAFYLIHLRAWELLIGSLLGLATWRGWRLPSGVPPWAVSLMSVAGLGAILWPVFAYNPETPFPAVAAVPPCLGAAVLIATGKSGHSIGARVLSWRPMVFVGKLSYSLYLWHWPVISLGFYMTGGLTAVQGLACLCVSGVLAYLSWRYIEQPFRKPQVIGQRAIFASSLGAMAVALALGVVFWKTEGLPTRMDADLMAMGESGNFIHDRRDCHFVTAQRGETGDVCIRGAAAAEPSFVLIGDSHADAFSPAIFAAAADLGLSGYQYTNAGFHPLPQVRNLGQTQTDDVDTLIAFLEARPALKTLILTGYWQHRFTGYSYRHAGYVWVDAEYDGSGSAYNKVSTVNGLTRLAARFPDRQLVVLDDVPTGDGLHMRAQLRLLRFNTSQPLGVLPAQAREQRQLYEPHLMKLDETVDNLQYRPIFKDLCDPALCPLLQDGVLMYRDGDHLSWQGALRLTGVARTLLASLP